MDNYRAWFRAKTETFKANYCNTVDNYFDLVLSQMDAITSRIGDESPRELSRMIRHMEDTNRLYKQQLDLLSRRYFAGKATFSSVSTSINDSTSSFTNQQQQDNGITKDLTGVGRIDHPSSNSQFGVQFADESIEKNNNLNTETTGKLSSTKLDPKCDCDDCQADAIRVQAESDLMGVASQFGNSAVDTSPSGDNLHPIEIDSESESDTEGTKVKSTGGRAYGQPNQGSSSLPTAFKRKWSSLRPSSAGTSIIVSPGARKRSLFSPESGALSMDAKRLRGVVQPLLSHTCSVCDLSFPSETLLEAHVLNDHSQQQPQQDEPQPFRPFACQLCDKTFTMKTYLASHMLVHSGLKNARCTWPDCSYDSAFKANVIAHIRTVHFKLPQTKKRQSELNIVDDRDPNEYVEKIQHELSGN